MPIVPKVPHNSLVVAHAISEREYVCTLSAPEGYPADAVSAPPLVFHRGSPEEGWHGWTAAHAIQALVLHMEYHQSTPFACAENAEALGHLHDALSATQRRSRDREGRGVLYDHKRP